VPFKWKFQTQLLHNAKWTFQNWHTVHVLDQNSNKCTALPSLGDWNRNWPFQQPGFCNAQTIYRILEALEALSMNLPTQQKMCHSWP
jgi:hypothetical protein